MAERRTPPSTEPIYSERDVLDFRLDWEAAKNREQTNAELSAIRGQLNGMPELVRGIARAVVLEVLNEQEKKRTSERRGNIYLFLGAMSALFIVVVPIEDAILRHLIP